jgi:hypothetical protein
LRASATIIGLRDPFAFSVRCLNHCTTRDESTFAAQWLAYALPCQRFANTLAGICA